MRHRFLSAASRGESTSRTTQGPGKVHCIVMVSMWPLRGHTMHLVSLGQDSFLKSGLFPLFFLLLWVISHPMYVEESHQYLENIRRPGSWPVGRRGPWPAESVPRVQAVRPWTGSGTSPPSPQASNQLCEGGNTPRRESGRRGALGSVPGPVPGPLDPHSWSRPYVTSRSLRSGALV